MKSASETGAIALTVAIFQSSVVFVVAIAGLAKVKAAFARQSGDKVSARDVEGCITVPIENQTVLTMASRIALTAPMD